VESGKNAKNGQRKKWAQTGIMSFIKAMRQRARCGPS